LNYHQYIYLYRQSYIYFFLHELLFSFFLTKKKHTDGKDSRVRGKITALADPTYRPNAGNMTLDRNSANGVAGVEGNTHNYQTQRAHLKHQKAQMLAGNGNPITGQEPEHYKIPTFRDLELLNHQQYG